MKNSEIRKILRELVKIPSVSGFEKELGISDKIASLINEFNPEIDELGNVVVKIGKGKKKILVDSHLDEVGFLTTDNKLKSIGDVNLQDVKIKNLCKTNNPDNLFYFKRRFVSKGSRVKSPALDNKAGCTALLLTLKELKKTKFSVYFVFSVQEETTSKGILALVKSIKPNLIISVDSAYAKPYKNKRWIIPSLGMGPAIQLQGRGFEINNYQEIEEIAKNNNIPYQFEVIDSKNGGTNLSALKDFKIKKFQINVPVKNQHSNMSELDLLDIKNTSRLLVKMLEGNLNKTFIDCINNKGEQNAN